VWFAVVLALLLGVSLLPGCLLWWFQSGCAHDTARSVVLLILPLFLAFAGSSLAGDRR
jgi:hypothetical protein